MKIKSFLEHQSTGYREVMYGMMDEFKQSRQKEVFTDSEYQEVAEIFEVDPFSYQIGKAFGEIAVVCRNGKSMTIQKLDDEYFTVAYFNPRFNYSKCYICDQFDALIRCLNMIKTKGWLTSNL